MATLTETSLLSKPRIRLPTIKICFEVYHALAPFHRRTDKDYPSLKKSAIMLFFVTLRWYFFLKKLINDKTALDAPFTRREKYGLFIAICGHLLIIWAQKSTNKHESGNHLTMGDENEINDIGPYSIIRHPHYLGKWVSESFVSIYQNNKISMFISIITLYFAVKSAKKDDEEYVDNNNNYQDYKRRVPNMLVPGIY
eukprot:143293_1